MNAHVLDIPDDPAEVAVWLDQHLVGLELAELVSELSAIQGDRATKPERLETLLGPHQAAVLDRGLSALPHTNLGKLLRRPQLLFELQDQVLLSGGPYWDRLASSSPQREALLSQGSRKVDRLTRTQGPAPELVDTGLILLDKAWWQRPATFVPAAAAALLVACLAVWQFTASSEPPPWGWNRPDVLANQGRADLYFDRLADSAEDWFKKRPDDRPGLTRRIEQFREGCSRLLAAPHRPLTPEDRAWLLERCQTWTAKLDAQLTALQQGQDPIQVRDEVDKTIHKLIDTLRAKARERSVAIHLRLSVPTKRVLSTN